MFWPYFHPQLTNGKTCRFSEKSVWWCVLKLKLMLKRMLTARKFLLVDGTKQKYETFHHKDSLVALLPPSHSIMSEAAERSSSSRGVCVCVTHTHADTHSVTQERSAIFKGFVLSVHET